MTKGAEKLVDYEILPGTALTPDEAEWLAQQAAASSPEAITVHLGIDWGASMICSMIGAQAAATRAGIDLQSAIVPVFGIDANPAILERMVGFEYHITIADSRVVAWQGPVDFLFVDADHAAGSVLADIHNWHGRIREGGVMAFHDYGNNHLRWCKGVKAAVDSWDWTGWQEIPAPDSIKAFRKLGKDGAE